MVMQQPPSPLVVLIMPKRLVGMNAHTGQRVWEFETGYLANHARVFVDQGRVFFCVSDPLPKDIFPQLTFDLGATRTRTA